ncbi:MAG TPA: hypothetical protein VIE65_08685 [Methylobacter sp.]|jgi:hypothetical protein
MATKNLARTVIEGGRYGSNKFDRRRSNKLVRHQNKLAINSREDADFVAHVIRLPVRKEFRDKLSPLRRFLDANIGQNWKKLYAEIREKFDDRTTAGRHILFDHLLRDINGSGQPTHMYGGRIWCRYFIDKNGCLRKHPERTIQHKRPGGPSLVSIAHWIGERGIIVNGSKIYWGISTNYQIEMVVPKYGILYYKPIQSNQFNSSPFIHEIHFRQDSEFTPNDYSFWEKIPASIQEHIKTLKLLH